MLFLKRRGPRVVSVKTESLRGDVLQTFGTDTVRRDSRLPVDEGLHQTPRESPWCVSSTVRSGDHRVTRSVGSVEIGKQTINDNGYRRERVRVQWQGGCLTVFMLKVKIKNKLSKGCRAIYVGGPRLVFFCRKTGNKIVHVQALTYIINVV